MPPEYELTTYLHSHNTCFATPHYRDNMPAELFESEEHRQTPHQSAQNVDDRYAPSIFNIQRAIDLEWELYKPWYAFLAGQSNYSIETLRFLHH